MHARQLFVVERSRGLVELTALFYVDRGWYHPLLRPQLSGVPTRLLRDHELPVESLLNLETLMSRVQTRADEMMEHHGFLGVPRETFEVGGRAQLARLLDHGLTPESKVLDIGCGCLRVAYWLVRFLDSDCYCGIEPARQRVEHGQRYLFSREELKRKRPRFDFNARFDSSVFAIKFDYFLAGSIWTHCSKADVEATLDGFQRDTGPMGAFLASYLPATAPEDDYLGESWIGTSHESDTPGVIRHSFEWINEVCQRRRLKVKALPGIDCDSQYWLRIDKR